MQQKFCTIASGTAIMLTVAILSGCAAGGSPTPGTSAASAAPAATAPVATAQPAAHLGDVALLPGADGKPVAITDAGGSYQKGTINPDASVFALDSATFDGTMGSAGWSDEDVRSSPRWLMTFIAEQAIDSIAVDGVAGWEEWKATLAAHFIAPEWSTPFADDADGKNQNYFIVNNPGYVFPTLVRDGTPRMSSATISLDKVRSFDLDTGTNLVFEGVTTIDYRVTDAERSALLRMLNPDATEETPSDLSPKRDDGVDEDLPVTFEYVYAVRPDGAGGWLIIGYDNTMSYPDLYQASPQSALTGAVAYTLPVRASMRCCTGARWSATSMPIGTRRDMSARIDPFCPGRPRPHRPLNHHRQDRRALGRRRADRMPSPHPSAGFDELRRSYVPGLLLRW